MRHPNLDDVVVVIGVKVIALPEPRRRAVVGIHVALMSAAAESRLLYLRDKVCRRDVAVAAVGGWSEPAGADVGAGDDGD